MALSIEELRELAEREARCTHYDDLFAVPAHCHECSDRFLRAVARLAVEAYKAQAAGDGVDVEAIVREAVGVCGARAADEPHEHAVVCTHNLRRSIRTALAAREPKESR